MKIKVKFLANTKGNLSINLTPLTNHPYLGKIHTIFSHLANYLNLRVQKK